MCLAKLQAPEVSMEIILGLAGGWIGKEHALRLSFCIYEYTHTYKYMYIYVYIYIYMCIRVYVHF